MTLLRTYGPGKFSAVNPSITAVISKEWKQRMLLMTAIVAGAGCWFMYDGLVGYPKNNVRAAVYLPLRDSLGRDTPDLEKAWEDEARARGWSDTPPKKMYSAGDIQTQIVIASLALLGAGLCARHYFASLKTTTRLEDGKILLPDGRIIPLDKVRAVSRKRWKNKGIADLVYEAGPGRMKKILLDDYKYIGAEQILLEVEKGLPQEGATTSPAAPKPDETAPGNY
jgi:hypothetical protein